MIHALRQRLPLTIGTRGSPLALKQASLVKAQLIASYPDLLTEENIQFSIIQTSGDRFTERNLSDIGGKGLFTKEIEEALLSGAIDLAVHSMKDMPTLLPQGLMIGCLLKRANPLDAFISLKYTSWKSLPVGAIVGTSSLRRQAQILTLRPDIQIIPFRGNVGTRLTKLSQNIADATFLAVAGLERLSQKDAITEVLTKETMLPAVAQGALGIEIREEDEALKALLLPLHDEPTALCIATERAFLATLDGNCRTPLAALATLSGTTLTLEGLVATPDGTKVQRLTLQAPSQEAVSLGIEVATRLKNPLPS